MMTHWLSVLPLETGPNNENMSIYGPYEWLQLRWSAVILLGLLSLLPLMPIQAHSFARPGLYPSERNWLISVLILTTTIIPMVIFLIWYQGLPILFELSEASGRPDGVLVKIRRLLYLLHRYSTIMGTCGLVGDNYFPLSNENI